MGRRGVQLIVVMATALLLASGVALADTFYGTVYNDNGEDNGEDPVYPAIRGTDGSDYINGQNGDDILQGCGDIDTVYGSLDNDTIYGDDGDPNVINEDYLCEPPPPADPNDPSNDPWYGDDKLYGENGKDSIYGGPGDDTLDGSLDDDYLYGEEGNDKLFGSIGADYLYGGDGCDSLYGSLNDDWIYADDGDVDSDCLKDETNIEGIDDTVYGEDGSDNILAKDGKKDKIYCGFGEDWVWADNVDVFPAPENCEHVLPETTITSHPADPTNNTTAIFSFNSTVSLTSTESGSTFQCRLDSTSESDWLNCSSPKEYTGLSEGFHTFEVRATEPDGNYDKTPASYSWTVDKTAPDTTIGSQKPANPTNSTSASFGFSSSESNSTFECQLDNGGFTDCSSGSKSYSNLKAGSHTFEVKATDAAGNVDASPASYTWTVNDTTRPTVTSVAPANGATGVVLDRNIRATFSEAMNQTSLNGSTLVLINIGTSQKVDATVSYPDTNTVRLDPKSNLAKNTRYRVRIEGAGDTDNLEVRDLAGNALATDYTWTFTTGSS